MWMLLLLAQSPNWPGVSDPRLNGYLHDLGHPAAATAVIAGTGLLTDWPLETRTVLGTVALPIAQEVFDVLYWGAPVASEDAQMDFLTYQLPWAYYFARKKKWLSAIYTVLLYGAFLHWRYSDRGTSFRDSVWFHGAVVGGYTAGMSLVGVNARTAYLQAAVLLSARELMQLATGVGSWSDLASGILLPAPYLLEREKA